MTARIQLMPGFIVTVRGENGEVPDLSGATDVKVTIKRPDESVVVRAGRPVGGQRLEVALHSDDLSLPGEYLGEVRCTMGDEHVTFSPAFGLRLGGV